MGFEAENKIYASFESINIYDIYRDCITPDSSAKLARSKFFKSFKGEETVKNTPWKYTPWVFNRNPKETNESLKGLYSKEDSKLSDDSVPPCTDAVGPNYFFNSKEVKEALYVPQNIRWGMCSSKVGAHYHVDREKGSIFLYEDLIKSGIKIMKYSGDTDAAVPFTGTRQWIYNLKLETLKKWRSWRVNDKEVAGYVVKYKGLTFVTVKGTGHMVPQWKKKEAFHMLTQFLNGGDL